jgi:hypothetical protein
LSRAGIDDESLRAAQGLRNLRELDISDNKLLGNRGLWWLRDLRQLHALDASGTAVTAEGLSTLEALQELRVLKLNENRGLDDTAGERLAKLACLRELELARTLVGDRTVAALSRLPSLKKLDLSYTSITNDCLKDLKQFPALEVLVISGDRAAIASLRHERPDVNVIVR